MCLFYISYVFVFLELFGQIDMFRYLYFLFIEMIGVILSTATSSNRPLLPKRRKKKSHNSALIDPASATINRIRAQVRLITRYLFETLDCEHNDESASFIPIKIY